MRIECLSGLSYIFQFSFHQEINVPISKRNDCLISRPPKPITIVNLPWRETVFLSRTSIIIRLPYVYHMRHKIQHLQRVSSFKNTRLCLSDRPTRPPYYTPETSVKLVRQMVRGNFLKPQILMKVKTI